MFYSYGIFINFIYISTLDTICAYTIVCITQNIVFVYYIFIPA